MYLQRNTLVQTARLNAIFTGVVKTLSAGSGLLIGALLSRMLSIELVGAYFVFLHLIRVSAVITRMGLSDNSMRLIAIAADQNNWVAVAGHIKSTLKVISCAFACLVAIYYIFWPTIITALNLASLKGVLWVFFLCIAIRASEDHITFTLKGLHHVKLGVTLLNSPRQIISVAFLFYIWLRGINLTLNWVFILYLGASIPASVAGVFIIRKILPCQMAQVESMPSLPLLKNSMPYWGMNLLSILMASVPLWLVSGIIGQMEAGLYGAAIQLTFLISFFLGINNQITPPALAALFASDEKEQLETILRKTAGWGLMLSTPAVIILLFFGEATLSFVYGPAYRDAGTVLVLLTLGQFINAAAGSPGMMLQMSGKQSALLKITSFWMTLNLIGGITLAPSLGMNGIAAAHCLTLIGQNITMVILVRRQVGVRTYARFDFRRLRYSTHGKSDSD